MSLINQLEIGSVIGIYEVLETDIISTKDKRKRVRVKCTKCGIEKLIRPINLGATKCTHKQKIIPKFCEYCGKPIPFTDKTNPANYRLRHYCSSSCAASVNNHRVHSDESKAKASTTLLVKNNKDNLDLLNGKLQLRDASGVVAHTSKNTQKYYVDTFIEGIDFVKCPYCGLRFGQLRNSHLRLHNKTTDILKVEFGIDYQLASEHSMIKRAQASREAQQRLITEGRHKGWQSRNITSYAEKFWINVLYNYKIEYRREVPVKHNNSNYFLDFVIAGINGQIDLEIDGKQHKYDARAKSDAARDEYLSNLGYKVYRIPWINPYKHKEEVQQQIDNLLEYIRDNV